MSRISSQEWELYSRSLDGARREAAMEQLKLFHVFKAAAKGNWEEAERRLKDGVAIDTALLLSDKNPSAMPGAETFRPEDFAGERITLLAWAAMLGDEQALGWALQRGAAVQMPVFAGRDAAWLAAEAGQGEIAVELLRRGALPTLRLSDGTRRTRLMGAVIARSVETVRALVAKKVPIEAYDTQGRTALHWNMLQSPYDETDAAIGRILLAEGANPNSEDMEGIPAHALAEDGLQQELLEGYKLKDATMEVLRRVAELRAQPAPEPEPFAPVAEPEPGMPHTPQINKPPPRRKKPKPFTP